jgi:predicted glycosyltransferase
MTRSATSNRRIALYSHDACGLGHMRRNLAVARALTEGPERAVLMLAGAREAALFPMPPGTDCVALPALGKDREGGYRPRSLAVSYEDVLALRSEMARSALETFSPDVLIVDKLPLGVGDELRPALEHLTERGGTRVVLGMREILDEPSVVRREWVERGYEAALERHYDEIWIYGDRRVYDPVVEYGLSSAVAAKARYSGYIDRRVGAATAASAPEAPDSLEQLELPPGRLALCTVGGGQDGQAIAQAFASAPLPPDTNGVIVAGPLMAPDVRARLHRRAEGNPRLRVLDFVEDPQPLLDAADSVVAMGGYNTICELLAAGKRALIVPRVWPRQEQIIRARRMSALGLVDMLHPRELTSHTLGTWLAADHGHRPHPRELVDLNGLDRLPAMLEELGGGRHETRAPVAGPRTAEGRPEYALEVARA